ncbi:hypothetical protein D3C84_1224670 [compost metagenome]
MLFESTFCSIKFSPMGQVSYFKGDNGNLSESCFVSRCYGQKDESSRLLLSAKASLAEVVVEFGVMG